jgi:cyanophycinase-like exopeptidase
MLAAALFGLALGCSVAGAAVLSISLIFRSDSEGIPRLRFLGLGLFLVGILLFFLWYR